MFAVRFTYNTQRIEGSTLSLKDTARLLEDGITPASRPVDDVREAEAHRTVFLDAIREGGLSRDRVVEWHRRLFGDTKEDIAGKSGTMTSGLPRAGSSRRRTAR